MAVTTVQARFRFRTDAAAVDTAATWAAAENVNWAPTSTQAKAPFRLRFTINSTGTTATASSAWQLYMSRNGGAYAPVTTTTPFVQSADAGASADETAITSNQLTAGSGTRVSGVYDETGATAAKILGATSYMELEFGVTFNGATEGDTYDFRVYLAAVALSTYTVTPRVTVPTETKTLARKVHGYQFSNDAADLTGSTVNKFLEDAGATAGTWTAQSLAAAASVVGSFFTPVGHPGGSGSVTISYASLNLNVTTGNTNVVPSVRLLRVDATGVIQATGLYSAEASGAAGTKAFEPPVGDLGTFAATDRLRVEVRLRNTSASTGQSLTITYASSECNLAAGWSNADMRLNYGEKGSEITLSASDLKVTKTVNSSNYQNVLSTASIPATGAKVVCEVACDLIGNAGSYGIGVASPALGLDGATVWIGNAPSNSVGFYANGAVYINGSFVAIPVTYTSGDRLQFAVDSTLKKAWIRNLTTGSGWNGGLIAAQDPGAGLGGTDISGVAGPWYVVVCHWSLNDALTAAFTNLTGSIPAGFTALDGTAFGVSGVYSLALDCGTVAVAGQAAGLKTTRQLTLAAGALPTSGQSAGLKLGRKLSLAAGAVPVLGQAVTVKATRTLPLAVGLAPVTGIAATFTKGVPLTNPVLSLGQGAVPVAGRAAGLAIGRKAALAMGAIPVAGRVALFVRARTLPLAQGAVPVIGRTALFVRARTLPLAMGAVPLSGQGMVPRAARQVILALGSVPLSGQGMVPRATRKLPLALGAVPLNGQGMVPRAIRQVILSKGAVPLSGQGMVPKAARKLPLALGSVPLSGQAISFAWARKLPLAMGSVPLSGQGMVPRAARQVILSKGAVPLSGQSVNLRIPGKITLDRGLAPLTGQALGFKATRTLLLSRGNVPVSGQVLALTKAKNLALTLGLGAVPLSGRALGIRATRILSLSYGLTQVVGQPIQLKATKRLSLAPLAIPVSGLALSLKPARNLALSSGVLPVSGGQVAFLQTKRLFLALGIVPVIGRVLDLAKRLAYAADAEITGTVGQDVLVGQSTKSTLLTSQKDLKTLVGGPPMVIINER
jgi:hypothetical protein